MFFKCLFLFFLSILLFSHNSSAQSKPTKNYVLNSHFINTEKGAFTPYLIFKGYTTRLSNVFYYYIIYPSKKAFVLVFSDGAYQIGTFNVHKIKYKKYALMLTPQNPILHKVNRIDKYKKNSLDSLYFNIKINKTEPILDVAKEKNSYKSYFSRVNVYDLPTETLKFSSHSTLNAVELIENLAEQNIQTTITLPRFFSDKVRIDGISPIWGTSIDPIVVDIDSTHNYYDIELNFCDVIFSSMFFLYLEYAKKMIIIDCEAKPCIIEDEIGGELEAHQLDIEDEIYLLLYPEYLRFMDCLQKR